MQNHRVCAVARSLAAAFVCGEMREQDLVARGQRILGRRSKWLKRLCKRIARKYAGRTRPSSSVLAKAIANDTSFQSGIEEFDPDDGDVSRYEVDDPNLQPKMCAVSAARDWNIVSLTTSRQLADWLNISVNDLDWFADRRHFSLRRENVGRSHYVYRTLTKNYGQSRLIEAPKSRLKSIQRRILTGILDHVPPHSAVHGFRCGHSIRTFARPHVGKDVVVKLDLQDFFPSIRLGRIRALFRSLGYPEIVANLLAALCTNSAPRCVWDRSTDAIQNSARRIQQRKYEQPHLPQGAPTSPALANLAAYRMDCRLAGLARSAGATYTRYADDLAFSGDKNFARTARRFHLHASAIVMEEGFLVHHRKTRIMRQGVQQRVAGVVVNQKLNVRRKDFDRLKATLTNCIRHGADSQNRDAHKDFRSHLEGRVAFVESINANRGQRLRSLLQQIDWN